jgi:LPXTG-motif cell wall-anchored protein
MGKKFCATVAIALVAVGVGGSGQAWAGPCSPSGTSLALAAEKHAFDRDCLAVRAGEAFTIRFENRDSDRHNVAILPSHTSAESQFQGDILPGPKNTVYAVPSLKAGTYHFHCEIHPNLMNGTFIVSAAPPATSAKPSTTPSPTMSMGEDTPAAAPAQAPKPDAAPRTAASAPSPAGSATGSAAASRTPAVAGDNLPRTGPDSSRMLILLAGLALAAGGLSVFGSAGRAES